MRKLKKEMETFYKQLIKVLFVDQINKQEAILLEKEVNMLIMNMNDLIDEVEIR